MSRSRVEADGASILRAFLQPMSLFLAKNTGLVNFPDSRYLDTVWAVSKSMLLRSADEAVKGGRRFFGRS